jgi:chromosomal replication initiator protein
MDKMMENNEFSDRKGPVNQNTSKIANFATSSGELNAKEIKYQFYGTLELIPIEVGFINPIFERNSLLYTQRIDTIKDKIIDFEQLDENATNFIKPIKMIINIDAKNDPYYCFKFFDKIYCNTKFELNEIFGNDSSIIEKSPQIVKCKIAQFMEDYELFRETEYELERYYKTNYPFYSKKLNLKNIQKEHIIWNNCLKVIKDNISLNSYKTWFEPIVPLKLENNILTIQIPSPFFYEYLEEQYIDILKKTLRRELGNDAKLEYKIVLYKDHASHNPYIVKLPIKSDSEVENIPFSTLNPEYNEIMNPLIIPGIKKLNIDPRLNPSNSFKNFIEGECNRLVRSAGYAVANHPGGTAFNPLLIYGESGMGKTHLAQAIGLETKEKFPEKIVLYVNANKFQTQFVDSIRNNNKNDFLHFYQMIDVLIIDDVHEFSGKEKTQDIFFQIFNHLHQSGKQLILTSNKPPVELQGIDQRLLSRFKWGLSADLQLPDLETRLAILRNKIDIEGIEIPSDILEYIAANVEYNVRELEGALISILAQSTLNEREITIELTKEIIDRIIRNTKKEISIDYIQKVICSYFNINLEQLHTNTRKKELVQARQIAMYFSKGLTKCSLATIGSQIGGKDYATVLHACKTIDNLIEIDKRFRQQIEDIEKKLKI